MILWHAKAITVYNTKVVLRMGIILHSRLTEPANRLAIVLSYAMTLAIHKTQVRLRFCVPSFS